MSYRADKLQAQNCVKFDFEVKFDLEDQCQLPLNQDVLHIWSKFGYPSLNGSRVVARTSSWLTHRRTHSQTHTHTQTQATIPEGQKWPRATKKLVQPVPKISSKRHFRFRDFGEICVTGSIESCQNDTIMSPHKQPPPPPPPPPPPHTHTHTHTHNPNPQPTHTTYTLPTKRIPRSYPFSRKRGLFF